VRRVVIEHFGGPEVVKVVEADDPRPGRGEVCVRVLASGVSFTDAQLRAGTYLGGPKPPFTPGYELVGVVEKLGPACTRLRAGDRVGALTVWGANAERVCVPEAYAVEVPEELDPAEVVSLVFTYMTAYQLLHRAAKAKSGETVLVHGAAGRVGTAILELGALAGLRLYGTASASDRAAVERLGAVAIDYQHEDFLARVRELPGKGVDVALDGIGGALSLRSFRALRPGGRLVVADYIRAARPLDRAGEHLLHEGLDGWAIPDLDTRAEHARHARAAGFSQFQLDDVTQNTRPSLRRLYRMSNWSYPIAKLGHMLGIRSAIQHGNVFGSLRQYQALERGLWFYGILSATLT
jgi:NADPH:quinone reductase-like Zn-dependent oxidoreductase